MATSNPGEANQMLDEASQTACGLFWRLEDINIEGRSVELKFPNNTAQNDRACMTPW